MLVTDLTNSLIKAILINAKVSESAVNAVMPNIIGMFDTMGQISVLGRHETSIKANDGNRYDLEEYKPDERLKPLVTPRSVTFTSDENSPELRVGTLIGIPPFEKNAEQSIVSDVYDSLGIPYGEKLQPMDYITGGSKVGCLINTIELGKKTVGNGVQTPGKFMEAQSQLFSLFKSNIGNCVSMKELTKPVLLSDVTNRVDNGVNTLPTALDNLSLPITLKCVNFLYKDYMYSYPLKDFTEEFVSRFVVTSLCARPIN